PKDIVTRFLAGDRLRGFVAENGKDVVIIDGHHKLTALLALRGLVGASMFGGTHVPVLFCEERPLYLVQRDGTVRKKAVKSFAKLEDNPFRKLAADLALRVRGEPGAYRIEGPDGSLWIKGPRAEEYVEFRLALVLERAFEKAGITWTPDQKLTDRMRKVAH